MPPETYYTVVDRHILFFAKGTDIPESKLKEYFTSHAISEFIKYGYLKKL